MKIFLDMDDVLCDFIGGLERLWKVDIKGMKKRGELRGVWSVVEALGKNLDVGQEFWANLEPHEWMDDLLTLCNRLSNEVTIITHPQHYEDCYRGKLDWFFKHLKDRSHIVLSGHKERFASPDSVLIDDNTENCVRFWQRGGSSIVFPAVMNGLIFEVHPMVEVPLELEKVINKLQEGEIHAPSIQRPK